MLRDRPADFLEDETTRFTALAVDIGDDDLARCAKRRTGCRRTARTSAPWRCRRPAATSSCRAPQPLPRVPQDGVPAVLLEPQLRAVAAGRRRDAGGLRALPACRGEGDLRHEYYQGHEIATELDAFAESVNASRCTPIVVHRVQPRGRHRQRHRRRPRPPPVLDQARPPSVGGRHRRAAVRRRRRGGARRPPVPGDQRARLHDRHREEQGRHGGVGRPVQEPVHRRVLHRAAERRLHATKDLAETHRTSTRASRRSCCATRACTSTRRSRCSTG